MKKKNLYGEFILSWTRMNKAYSMMRETVINFIKAEGDLEFATDKELEDDPIWCEIDIDCNEYTTTRGFSAEAMRYDKEHKRVLIHLKYCQWSPILDDDPVNQTLYPEVYTYLVNKFGKEKVSEYQPNFTLPE